MNIHAMAAGVQGHAGFAGQLPDGLCFDLIKTQATKLPGAPAWSSSVLPDHRRVFGAYRLLVCFKVLAGLKRGSTTPLAACCRHQNCNSFSIHSILHMA
jgi:hypothetical protein